MYFVDNIKKKQHTTIMTNETIETNEKEAQIEQEKKQEEPKEQSTNQPETEQEAVQEAEENAGPTLEEQLATALKRIEELEKERLYKQAEFENYRRNAIKEKTDLILNGGKKVLESMLPVMDDFELALQHMTDDADIAAVKEGVELIEKKFAQVMKGHGVEAIDAKGKDFDTDYHEAIAQFPAPAEELKGKVVDCTKKGYTLNGKVLRFAQVVVGV